jgi:hypothetical protein
MSRGKFATGLIRPPRFAELMLTLKISQVTCSYVTITSVRHLNKSTRVCASVTLTHTCRLGPSNRILETASGSRRSYIYIYIYIYIYTHTHTCSWILYAQTLIICLSHELLIVYFLSQQFMLYLRSSLNAQEARRVRTESLSRETVNKRRFIFVRGISLKCIIPSGLNLKF